MVFKITFTAIFVVVALGPTAQFTSARGFATNVYSSLRDFFYDAVGSVKNMVATITGHGDQSLTWLNSTIRSMTDSEKNKTLHQLIKLYNELPANSSSTAIKLKKRIDDLIKELQPNNAVVSTKTMFILNLVFATTVIVA